MTKIHDTYNGYANTEARRDTVKKARKKLFNKEFPVPMEIVYIIKDETGEIIYVGESVNSKAFHKGQFKKAYCKEFWTYEVIEVFSKKERLIKEIELEFKHEPKYNKRWQTK
jgi:hypothetical protein